MSKKEVSKRQEWESKFCLWNNNLIKAIMESYDRGHADGLSEGAELRKELVEALKNSFPFEHDSACIFYHDNKLLCDCYIKKYIALIAQTEGGEQ